MPMSTGLFAGGIWQRPLSVSPWTVTSTSLRGTNCLVPFAYDVLLHSSGGEKNPKVTPAFEGIWMNPVNPVSMIPSMSYVAWAAWLCSQTGVMPIEVTLPILFPAHRYTLR